MTARVLLCFFIIYILDRGLIGIAAENAVPDWATETYRVISYPVTQIRRLFPEEESHGD